MSTEVIQGLLTDFGKTINIPDLSLDEHGYCCLVFDEVTVNFDADQDERILFLYARVGELPRDPSPELLAMLLEGNFFFRQTAGATLGIDTKAGIISLVYRAPVQDMDLNAFQKTLEDFVNAAEHWMKRVGEFQGTDSSSAIVKDEINIGFMQDLRA